jgi:uncharacterized protein (TIGR02246 family)
MTTSAITVATTVLTHLQDAWNASDGARYGAVFSEDSDFVTIRGEHFRGSHVIADGHQRIFDSLYQGSTVKLDLANAREVAPRVVLAVATSMLDAPSGPLRGRHNSRMTVVITSGEDGWRVAGLHNTLIADGA